MASTVTLTASSSRAIGRFVNLGGRGAGIIQCRLNIIVERITDFNFEREEFASFPAKSRRGGEEQLSPLSPLLRQPCLVE